MFTVRISKLKMLGMGSRKLFITFPFPHFPFRYPPQAPTDPAKIPHPQDRVHGLIGLLTALKLLKKLYIKEW